MKMDSWDNECMAHLFNQFAPEWTPGEDVVRTKRNPKARKRKRPTNRANSVAAAEELCRVSFKTTLTLSS